MLCIKTGFYGRLPGGFFIYGDAFALEALDSNTLVREERYEDDPIPGEDHLLLRICAQSRELDGNRLHIELNNYKQWFDERSGKKVNENGTFIWQPNSTLIASPGQWKWLGYEGKEV